MAEQMELPMMGAEQMEAPIMATEQMEAPMMATENPMSAMEPEAREAVMQPDEEIQIVLMARLGNLQPEELRALDELITPETARIIMKILPELGMLMEQVEMQQEQPVPMEEGNLGALGDM